MLIEIKNHLKNIKGNKIKRKLVVFSVDDYGNVRLANLKAKEQLLQKGVKFNNRFDHFDALDTREDYEMLFDVLSSVKDGNGNSAIFTTYSLTCNINNEKTLEYGNYIPEDLNETYYRLGEQDKAYERAFELLIEGIHSRFIKPQFHGREHLNVNLINIQLKEQNPVLLANLENNSLVGVSNHPSLPNVDFNQAFAFWNKEEIEMQKEIIKDGLNRFEKLYGYKSITFTPPAQQIHADLYAYVRNLGVVGIDKVRSIKRHHDKEVYVKEKNTLGETDRYNTFTIVRNCVFEPTDKDIDWVNFTFKQIEAAFFWGKPAIISSHRVNFCGHIDSENRKQGLSVLSRLLKKIVQRWPDVEFVSIEELISIMHNDK